MIKNRADFNKANTALFNRLKELTTDENEFYQLAKEYELLQEEVLFSNDFTDNEKSEITVIIGRAMSNIIEKIKVLQWFTKLENLDLNKVNNEHHFVFLGHRGGLCNRLRAVAGLAVLANYMNVKFSWNWFATLSCTGIIPKNRGFLFLSQLILYKINNKHQNIVIVDDPNSLGFFYNHFNVLLNGVNYGTVHKEYIQVSKLLLYSVIHYYNLSAKIFKFIATNTTGKFNAVHIRQTDFIDHFKQRYPNERLPTVDEYISHIQSNPNTKYFLSSDESEIRKAISSQCSNVFMWDHQYDSDKLRQVGFEDTLLDLAVLIESDKLVITPHSSFSQYVVEAGGIDAVKLT